MKKIFLIILLSPLLFVFAQEQNPPSIKWKQIKSEHFHIIYPKEATEEAQDIINKLEHLYVPCSDILGSKPKPISLVLFNQSATTNAYARLAPRMMGWYLTPYNNTNLSITDWTTTLAIHEQKHVTQYSKLNSNFTKLASIIFGQYGQVVLSNISTPTWFFEGEAVYAETIFTNSGRGRTSNFSLPIRTILLSDKKIKYNKALMRSYKTYYPNHYYLGYYMVTHVTRNYGDNAWSDILNRTTKFSYSPFSFSRSLKKRTGAKVKKTYKNAMHELDSLYREQIKGLEFTDVQIINTKKKRSWTNYTDAEFIDNNNIYIIKNGFDLNSTIFLIDEMGYETKIKEIDASVISYANNKIVWEQTNYDIRWGERSFKEIMVFNTETKKTKQISKKGKYFSTCISPEGSKIVAVEYNTLSECALVILNSETGEVIEKQSSPNGDFIRSPIYSQDGSKIVFSHNSANGEGISYYDVETKKYVEIIANGWERISKPVFYGNYIIYNSDYSGIGNIYAIDIESKERYQVVSRKFGAYNAKISPENKHLLFEDYNLNGYDIAKMPINKEEWIEIKNVKVFKEDYFLTEKNKSEIKSIVEPEQIEHQKYEESNYNLFKSAINIHSWTIAPADPTIDDVQATIYSNNKLNTLIFSGGLNASTRDKAYYGFLNASYQKYFPVFDISAMYGNRTLANRNNGEITSVNTWFETNIIAGVNLPLNLSKGIYNSQLSIGTEGNYKIIEGKKDNFGNSLPENGSFAAGNYYASYYRTKRGSWRDISPRFGQSLYLSYRNIPLSDNFEGYRFHVSGKLYFPGLLKHHNLMIDGAYEQQLIGSTASKYIYYFSSGVTLPRGYAGELLDDIIQLSVNYQLPLFYPDFGIGSLIYFKRVRYNSFYDFAIGSYQGNEQRFESLGSEFTVDFNVLRLPIGFNAGLRFSYVPSLGQLIYEPMIMGMSIPL